MNRITTWHFAAKTLRDGSPLPRAGEECPPLCGTMPCEAGMYHGSMLAIDALRWAPGPYVARVEQWQRLMPHGSPVDKWASQCRRNVTYYVDCTEALRGFTRSCARRVAHLGDLPEAMLTYLYHDHSDSARESALYSARGSAWHSARELAWYAVGGSALGLMNINLEMRLGEALGVVV